jgi:hypothetical protein
VTVAIDEYQHVALPKLMGQPAYARPPRTAVTETARPIDPDELPLEAHLDDEEREHARALRAMPFLAVPTSTGDAGPAPAQPRRRGFSILGLFSRDVDAA